MAVRMTIIGLGQIGASIGLALAEAQSKIREPGMTAFQKFPVSQKKWELSIILLLTCMLR
jgi:predicted dinucleotide-binding enzyme